MARPEGQRAGHAPWSAVATLHAALCIPCDALRAGLRQLLHAAGHRIAVETMSSIVLETAAATQPIDVVVLDAALLETATPFSPKVPQIVVAGTFVEALRLGDRADVPRLLVEPVTRHDLYAALRASQAGVVYLPISLATPFVGSPLTPREQALVVLQLQERTTGQIATALGIEEQSVRASRARIYGKLGVASLLGLQHWAETWRRRSGVYRLHARSSILR